MKLVKKLLRLLPFLLILFICISQLFINKTGIIERHGVMADGNDEIRTSYTYSDYFSNISNQLDSMIGGVYYEIPFVNNFNDTIIYDLLEFQDNNYSPIILRTFLCILWYELFLSLMFIMFDVFNFILGIANKWIKKGGNLDD